MGIMDKYFTLEKMKELELRHDIYYILTDVRNDRRYPTQALDDIMKLVNKLKAEYEELLKWTPVEEDLPKDSQETVIIKGLCHIPNSEPVEFKGVSRYVGCWKDYDDKTNCVYEVTHWRKINL